MSSIPNSSVVESSKPEPGKRKVHVPRRILMQAFEIEAVCIFRKHRRNKQKDTFVNEKDAILEEKFISAVKSSPSKSTIEYGIVVAVEAGWHKALEELLAVDLSTYKHTKSRIHRDHPIRKEVVSKLGLPSAHASKGRGWYVNSAMLYAIASGKVDTVKVMAKHMDLNIYGYSDETSLHYVYSLKQQDVKKQMWDVVFPKLKPSQKNVITTAKHGDLESTKYFIENSGSNAQYHAHLAVESAIKNGHDHLAKWIIEAPGMMRWKSYANHLIDAAVKHNNLEMIEYLSMYTHEFTLYQYGPSNPPSLRAFLEQRNRTELFSKFFPPHHEDTETQTTIQSTTDETTE